MDKEAIISEFLAKKNLCEPKPADNSNRLITSPVQSLSAYMEKEGWLKRLGKRGARYNRRYFVVKEGRIQSYASDREPDDQKNGILLSQCVVMEDQEELGHLRILAPYESFVLVGDSPDDTMNWLLFLNSASCLELYKDKCSQTGLKPIVQVADALFYQNRSLGVKDIELSMADANTLSDMLQNNTTFTNIEFSNCNITDALVPSLMRVFSSAKSLESLSLARNRVSSHFIPDLCESLYYCVSLVSLDLSHNEIDHIGAEYISELITVNASLKKVNIGYNRICSKGIPSLITAISGNSSITELILDGNPIGDDGAVLLGDAFKGLSIIHLRKIGLKSTSLTALGLQAILDALGVNECVQDLDISENYCDKETAKKIVSVFSRRHIERISIAGPTLGEADVSGALCKLLNISYYPSSVIIQREANLKSSNS